MIDRIAILILLLWAVFYTFKSCEKDTEIRNYDARLRELREQRHGLEVAHQNALMEIQELESEKNRLDNLIIIEKSITKRHEEKRNNIRSDVKSIHSDSLVSEWAKTDSVLRVSRR